MPFSEQFFESRQLASLAAASRMEAALGADLAKSESASLIVSGGTSPQACLNALAHADLAWNRVTVLMSDERYVPSDHPASNEGMIRRELLSELNEQPEIVSMFEEGVLAQVRCKGLEGEIESLPRPHSIGLLGMGEDGHFASLFPDFDRLEEGLNLDSALSCLPVTTVVSQHLRITLTLAALVDSNEIVLLFFGNAKRKVFEQSLIPGSSYPLARLLQQEHAPVHTIWAL